MRRRLRFPALALLAGSGVPACLLFTDAINRPPEVTIVVSSTTVYPNQKATFEARPSDPDGDLVTLSWSWADAPCDKATTGDWETSAPTSTTTFERHLLGHQPGCVRVIAQDDQGARSSPQTRDVVPSNREPGQPTLELSPPMAALPLYSLVRLQAGPVRDADDDVLMFTWKATSPTGEEAALAPCGQPDNPALRCLTAELPGTYQVTVEASDGIAASKAGTRTLAVVVMADQAPCIEATDPTADTAVVVLAVTDPPRRFEVRQVKDDGHPFPAGARGGATFQWFTAREGSAVWTRELGYDRPTFDVGASRFEDVRPGSVYRVRVEVRDPEHETPAALQELAGVCADRDLCRLPDTCTRWMTWSVRFR